MVAKPFRRDFINCGHIQALDVAFAGVPVRGESAFYTAKGVPNGFG
jgi:hypothetical protein